jgi:hypothetical protein
MFVEDLSPFFDTDTGFAVNATLGGEAVAGLLQSDPLVALSIGGSGISFVLPTASVPEDPRTLALVITGGATYTVRDWADDGTGVTTLQLEAA